VSGRAGASERCRNHTRAGLIGTQALQLAHDGQKWKKSKLDPAEFGQERQNAE
jgi:hypothetical protein